MTPELRRNRRILALALQLYDIGYAVGFCRGQGVDAEILRAAQIRHCLTEFLDPEKLEQAKNILNEVEDDSEDEGCLSLLI